MIEWFGSSQADKGCGGAYHKYESLAHKFVHGVNYLLADSGRMVCSDSALGIPAVPGKDTPFKQHAVVMAELSCSCPQVCKLVVGVLFTIIVLEGEATY